MGYRKPTVPRSALSIKMQDAAKAVERADRAALQRRRAYFDLRGSFANEMVREGQRAIHAADPASDMAGLGADGLAAWLAASQTAAETVDAIDGFLAAGGGSVADFEKTCRREMAAMALAEDALQRVAQRARQAKLTWLTAAWGAA